MRIVLDTSVLIAALRSAGGASAESLRLVLLGELTLLLDYSLVCEYRDVALRPEQLRACSRTAQEVSHLIDMLEAIAEPVTVFIRHRPLSHDQDDNLVLDVATNGTADVIVTFNTKHFREPARQFRLPVLTPSQLLSEFRKTNRKDDHEPQKN